MEKRILGKSHLKVFPIGLGCRTLGYKAETQQEAIEIVQEAVKAGINLVDTANIYRKGLSEEIIGKAIQSMRKEVILATKGGIIRTPEGLATQDLKTESLRQAVKDSLKRLQTDYIDLYQIHYPDPTTPFKETVKTLNEFIETGTIKYVGLSNFSPEELEEWTNLMEVPSVQLPYNFLQQKLYGKLSPICGNKKISMIVYTPLLMGLLTGKIAKDTVFRKGDERSFVPSHIIEACIRITDQLKPIAEKYNRTVAQLVLNFIIDQSHVGCVLVGASNVKQARENVAAAEWTMRSEDRILIEKIIKNVEASLGDQSFVQTVKDVFPSYSGKQVAIIETGMKFPVPSTVKTGDRIKISWNGEYLGTAD